VSPIIMSMRTLDESADLRAMQELIYQLYQDSGIPYALPGHEA